MLSYLFDYPLQREEKVHLGHENVCHFYTCLATCRQPIPANNEERDENTSIKKARVAELSPVPHFQASRIAHFVRNEQRRSPRRYAWSRSVHLKRNETMRALHTYPEDIYHCFDLCWYSSLRDFESVRTKASSKRLIYMCTHPCRFCNFITEKTSTGEMPQN